MSEYVIREENVGYCCGFMYERPDIDEMGPVLSLHFIILYRIGQHRTS